MELKDEQVEKYRAIYLEEYGRTIEKAQARIEFTSLVCMLDAVYKFNNKNNHE